MRGEGLEGEWEKKAIDQSFRLRLHSGPSTMLGAERNGVPAV
jgi:hypothetical protein